MEKIKLNDETSRVVADATDAADGHDIKPHIVEMDAVKMDTVAKAPLPGIANNSSKQDIAASEGSPNSSPSQKIVLSNCGDSVKSSAVAIHAATIPSGSEVWITHVRNHHTVFVRSVTANDAFAKMYQDLQTAAETAPKLKAYPYPKEDTVLAPFDGAYYRGMVLSCNENTGQVRVAYIDFGNSKEVPFSTLKVLPNDLKERPRFAFLLKLKNLKDQPDDAEIKAMKDHLDKLAETSTCEKLKVVGDREYIASGDTVEFFEVISNRSVSDTLNGMVQKRYRLSDIKQKILKIDPANVPLLMGLDTNRVCDNIITCLPKDDVQTFLTLDEHIQAYGDKVKNAPAYKPMQKELCVVRMKDPEGYIWYRCLYQTELVDDYAQVYSIDYGRIDTVRANSIRVSTIASLIFRF